MKINKIKHSVKERQNMTNLVKSSLPKKTLNKLWKKADDAVDRIVFLSEIYAKVPKELQDVSVRVVEFHDIKANKKIKKQVKKWLNRKD
jgi:hypothetical protein